jgi:xanthine dehydrogenase YagS FAD-binding subunit
MMKAFNHVNARTIDEAIGMLKSDDGHSKVIAGGTDLLGILKDKILPDYPNTIINLKDIKNLDYTKEDGAGLKVGALTRLEDIVQSPIIRERYKILSDAAKSVATPQIRNLGTIGGNLCQDVRCLYYRYSHQIGRRILCKRKGGGTCFAAAGDNRFSAIMGGKGCFAVCPSDMAVALTALNADIKVTGVDGSKMIPISDFYTTSGNVLGKAEIITELLVPAPQKNERTVFLKFRLRDAIDFAIVSVASAITMAEGLCKKARIVLGAVAPAPIRASASEAFLEGREPTEEMAEQAADMAVEKAKPLSMNAYKIQIAKKLVKNSIMATV